MSKKIDAVLVDVCPALCASLEKTVVQKNYPFKSQASGQNMVLPFGMAQLEINNISGLFLFSLVAVDGQD